MKESCGIRNAHQAQQPHDVLSEMSAAEASLSTSFIKSSFLPDRNAAERTNVNMMQARQQHLQCGDFHMS